MNGNVGRAIGNVAGRAGTLPAEPERCRVTRNVSGRPGTLAGPLERRKSNWLDSPPQLEAPALLFFQSACVAEYLTGARPPAPFLPDALGERLPARPPRPPPGRLPPPRALPPRRESGDPFSAGRAC